MALIRATGLPLLLAALALTAGAAGPAAPRGSGPAAAPASTAAAPYAPAGFRENSSGPRPELLALLGDLRVFVDLKAGDMPRSGVGGELSAAETREAVALGLGLWASVLPAMAVRLVDSPAGANLVVRFRDYGPYIPGGSTALAFLPDEWRAAPAAPAAPGAAPRSGYDFACGAETPGRLPSGAPCREGANNILLFQSREVAFRRVDFLDPLAHQAYLAAKTDRRKPFFRFLPDPRYQAWPPDRSTCVTGAARGGVLPAWDVQCPTEADWRDLPHFDRFGAVEGPYDIATLVQHEFGHALLGSHTGEVGGCLEVAGNGFRDFGRDTVYAPGSAVRRAAWRTAGGGRGEGYSVLFPGNGLDAAWNHRGIFEADAARLASGSLSWQCLPEGGWQGYATTYPASRAWIVLGREGGERKTVDDWRYAQRLMAWPHAGGRPAAGWAVVGLIPKK